MPLDIYIYLKGGRGDGFVPQWDGSDPMAVEEGTLVNGLTAADGKGLEVSEPYRDIFPAETQVGIQGDGVDSDNEETKFNGAVPMKAAFLPGKKLTLRGGEAGPIVFGLFAAFNGRGEV